MVQAMSYYILPTILALPSLLAVIVVVRYWVQHHHDRPIGKVEDQRIGS